VLSNRITYILFATHVAASAYHGWSHGVALVPTTALQKLFIDAVVVAAPVVAVTLIFARKLVVGYVLFAGATLGAFVFGVCYHVILDTRDRYSNVHGADAGHFAASAVVLAVIEFISFTWGVRGWRRALTHGRIIPSAAVGP
jgi:hypothetical protein